MPHQDGMPVTTTADAHTAPASSASLIGQSPVMMRGGIAGSHLALALAAVIATGLGGRDALVTTLLAGLTVSVLMIAGQFVQSILVQKATMVAMAATLAGFGIRVAALGAALAFWLANASRYPSIVDWAVVTGCVSVSLGWLAGVLVTYRRLRVPIYDAGHQPPTDGGAGR